MRRDALIRALRRYARKRGTPFDLHKARGKGAHYRVRMGEKVATVQSGELTPFHVERICKQLAIEVDDL